MTTTEQNWIDEVGKPAYDAIAEMVAALQADRERLEELREERDGYDPDDYAEFQPGDKQAVELWAERFPDEAEELTELEAAVKLDGEEVDEETARERIEEDPLSLRIFGERTGGEWEATSYELLLGTGGPAVRFVGDLDGDGATSARLEVQDWFKPWTEYPADEDVLLTYAGCFYMGE